MEVCCLKMASRCRPPRDVSLHGRNMPSIGAGSHDCGSLARVVMVRKTDQTVTKPKDHNNQQTKIVTKETIQTYRGHKPDRTFVTEQTLETPSSVPSICSSVHNDLQNLSISSAKENGKSPNPVAKRKSPSPPSSQFTLFQRESLDTHNEYRLKHGVPPLKLSKSLCKFAEEWAKIIAQRGNAVHRNNSPYGENIFSAWSSAADLVVNGREPVDNWYSEITSHAFGKEPSSLKTGHFTQVVWSDSRELGIAQAKNRNGQVFVVANYDPPGNFIGSFGEKVPPIGGFAAVPKSKSAATTPRTSRVEASPVPVITSPQEFNKQILKYHNEFRKKHGAPELKICHLLNRYAQEWAETLAREDRFAHRPNSQHGENLYCLWSSDPNAQACAKDVCRSWYDEIKEYTFGVEPRGVLKAGHFTQLVWKSSLEIGVGVAKTKKGKTLVVCNYSPRGNIIGSFAKNVLKSQ